MKILVASVNTDIITDEVNYTPLIITDCLQDAIDYIKKNAYCKYLHVEKFAFFTLRDRDKLTAHYLDDRLLID